MGGESDPSTVIVLVVISVKVVGILCLLIWIECVTCYYGYNNKLKDGRLIKYIFP